ncbi:hypothetical protein [Streptomyces lateritius]|uniref:hypothetical protein n=1 Tax=Streptomyces lateritius TaxID=67313 RepID=UPI001C8B9692|nr:hypothetical protein [Streptomyces lateritius]MBX9423970.1 hypothetical protein [Streptomyces lateritius]
MRKQNLAVTAPAAPFPTVKLAAASQETGPMPVTPRPARELPRTGGHRPAPARTRIHAPRRTY